MRAINRAGGTIEADWDVDRAFKIGDQATDGRTPTDCYGKMASQLVTVDLTHLWQQLGVRRSGQATVLDDSAPWATIREGICKSINKKG